MKLIYINLLLIFLRINGFAQTSKVAILDFENTSGKAEYDALGKAMSSMLITDLSNNIHPKKVEFFERTQLNKLLDEQKLQKSKNFDAKTAVDFGKLSGVNYVFVGSVFVMDGNCNITSKLVDVQTSKIVLSKEANGKIETWLQLKSQLAEAIAQQLNNPVTLDPSYRDQTTPLATLNQYGKVLSSMDQGDADKAEQMRSLFEETNPDFKYFVELKDDIDELKKQVAKNTADIEVLNQSGGRVINAKTPQQIVTNLTNQLTTYEEACTLIIKLLEFDINTVKDAMHGRFEQLWLPSIMPTDNLEMVSKNILFLEDCLKNKSSNSLSTSYYVFQKFRNYGVNWFTKDTAQYSEQIRQLSILGSNLKNYNLEHNIKNYDYKYFEKTVSILDGKGHVHYHPFEEEKNYMRELCENDFNIDWVLSFILQDNTKKNENAQYVEIGNQIWASTNLDVSHFRNGDLIPEAKSEEDWINAARNGQPAWCYYNNDAVSPKWSWEKGGKRCINGKLYNWYAVNDPRGLAPKGWHIPSSSEWEQLIGYLNNLTPPRLIVIEDSIKLLSASKFDFDVKTQIMQRSDVTNPTYKTLTSMPKYIVTVEYFFKDENGDLYLSYGHPNVIKSKKEQEIKASILKQISASLNGSINASISLKSQTLWEYPLNGMNQTGFNAFPTGGRSGYNGDFYNYGFGAYFWCSNEGKDSKDAQATLLGLDPNKKHEVELKDFNKSYGFSVRLLKD